MIVNRYYYRFLNVKKLQKCTMFERLMFRTSLHSAINLALYKELNLKCHITSVITMNKNISVKIFPFLG